MTQALALQQVLEKAGHTVEKVILVQSSTRSVPSFFHDKIDAPVVSIDGPGLIADDGLKSVHRASTLLHNLKRVPRLVQNVEKLKKHIDAVKPDVVINFYDLLTGLYNSWYRSQIPVVCVGHQYLFQHRDFSFPRGHYADRWFLNTYTRLTALRAKMRLALSFYPLAPGKEDSLRVIPPLMRQELYRQPLDRQEEFLLVYLLNEGYSQELIEWHKKHPEVPVHCFWDRTDVAPEERYDDTLTFHQLDDEKFLRLMARCSGLAATAGFESVCEAMYLGKPIYLVPVEGHYEQYCNAHDACTAGVGIRGRRFNLNPLVRYRDLHDVSPEPFRAWAEQGRDAARRMIETVVKQAA